MPKKGFSLDYKPDGETLRAFLKNDSFFKGLRGPIGSGKSVACCINILKYSLQQKPGPDGVRRTRWAVIRNTYPQLRTTTIKTWLEWFPEEIFGKFRWSVPFTHHLKFDDVDAEVIFLALDRQQDIAKLLSLELTGAFINEAREIPKAIVDTVTSRVSRYPRAKDGGPSWWGVIADTNAPDEDHWWPIMAGEVPLPDHIPRSEALMLQKPENWTFFTQPGGMTQLRDNDGNVTGYANNPQAENAKYLMKSYYRDLIAGKSKSWIDVYVLNKLGSIQDGKPVYQEFSADSHVAREEIPIIESEPLYVGIDFGLTPGATFAQKIRGRWLVLDEIVATDMGLVRFGDAMVELIMTRFAACSLIVTGDPAGDQRAQTDERTPFDILRGRGIKAKPAHTNDISMRIESVRGPLSRMIDGMSGILIDPRCKVLIRGFEGGYQYKKVGISAERHEDKPDKNSFSHVHDALQYMMLGGGEARKVLNRQSGFKRPTVKAKLKFNVFDRLK